MRLGEGGRAGSLSLTSFEPEFMRPVPPMLPIADSEVCRSTPFPLLLFLDRPVSTEVAIEGCPSKRFPAYVM